YPARHGRPLGAHRRWPSSLRDLSRISTPDATVHAALDRRGVVQFRHALSHRHPRYPAQHSTHASPTAWAALNLGRTAARAIARYLSTRGYVLPHAGRTGRTAAGTLASDATVWRKRSRVRPLYRR